MILRAEKNINTGNIVGYSFNCPGCNWPHTFWVEPFDSQTVWGFNGNLERPTFSPSLKNEKPNSICHLFVKDGQIEYCGDCTHTLAGQTIPVPEIKPYAEP